MKKVSKEELKQIVQNSISWADVCRALEISPRGGNYTIVKKLVADLDTSHFHVGPWNKGHKMKTVQWQKWDLKDVLIENSPHTNSGKLRERLIKEGLKESKCECCGNIESLELHHINGDHQDNRLENLQILCANCHRKTDTFRGKGIRAYKPASEWFITEQEDKKRYQQKLEKKKSLVKEPKTKKLAPKICLSCGKEFVPHDSKQQYCSPECYHNKNDNRPGILELITAFKTYKSFLAVGKFFNVTDNAVRRWCTLYKLPIKSKEIQELVSKIDIK